MGKSKSKRSSNKTVQRSGQTLGIDKRQQGYRAFLASSYDAAIAVWSGLEKNDPQIQTALAEAFFRRALKTSDSKGRISDLRRSITLCPDDLRYQYHLGLALHNTGDFTSAIDCYQKVLERDPSWEGATKVLALAKLELSPQVDLTTLPGHTPEIQALLAPVQTLLRNETVPKPTSAPENTSPGRSHSERDWFWYGMSQVRLQQNQATSAFGDTKNLPSARAQAIQHYYEGVLKAQSNNMELALQHWLKAAQDSYTLSTPWLHDNLAAAFLQRLQECLDADDQEQAGNLAQQVLQLHLNNNVLNATVVQVLDKAAQKAVATGDWQTAATLWEQARGVVSRSNIGSTRTLLHNLAVAYEMQEDWIQAAETWRTMLRTRPRQATVAQDEKKRSKKTTRGKKTPDSTQKATESEKNTTQEADTESSLSDVDSAGMTDAHWSWVRKRVIECYQRADMPQEAVNVFRQAIKSDPEDVDMRVQFVDALLANEQDQAALNELQRILQIDSQNIDAHMRLADIHGMHGEWHAAERALRVVLDLNPEREDVRRQVARLLLSRGHALHQNRLFDAATKAFQEGQQFAPDDYLFPLNLARIAIDQNKLAEVPVLLHQVLEIGADDSDAYIFVIECWAVAGDADAARVVLSQAKTNLSVTPDFYVGLGTMLLNHTTPQQSIGLFDFALPKKPPRITNTAFEDMAFDVLDQAVAMQPDTADVYIQIASELMVRNPDVGLRYAEDGLKRVSDNARLTMMVGLLQGLNGKSRDAKSTLRRAARLARDQGDAEIAEHIEAIRQDIDNPAFLGQLQLAQMLGHPDIDYYL